MNLAFFKKYDKQNLATKLAFKTRTTNYDSLLKIANKKGYTYVSEAWCNLHNNFYYTCIDLSDLFGPTQATISKHLKIMGRYSRNEICYQKEKHEKAIELGYENVHDCIVDQYKKLRSIRKVADIMGSSSGFINTYLKKYNIPMKPPGGPNSQKLKPEEIQEIISMHGKLTIKQIAKKFNVSPTTISRQHKLAGLSKKKNPFMPEKKEKK